MNEIEHVGYFLRFFFNSWYIIYVCLKNYKFSILFFKVKTKLNLFYIIIHFISTTNTACGRKIGGI